MTISELPTPPIRRRTGDGGGEAAWDPDSDIRGNWGALWYTVAQYILRLADPWAELLQLAVQGLLGSKCHECV